jgi:hypothetical protein
METCHRILNFLMVLVLAACFAGCSEDFSDNPQANQPPETHISIFSDNELNATTSRQTFNWWGDDPDGVVVGFIYTFDANAENVETWNNDSPALHWTFTEERGETFTLSLFGADTVYTLRVKAIDDDGAADPTPAAKQFPIINSRPSVEFPLETDVPETTFTFATFVWSGSDPDGNDNIAKYQYALDDTSESSWVDLDAKKSSITLTAAEGLAEGEHIFFLRAVDIAGANSAVIRMPREEDAIWYVREPQTQFLVLDDHNILDGTQEFYKSVVQSEIGAFDYWDIKKDGGALNPPGSEAFTKTLSLFNRILWFADGNPNLSKAQVGVAAFLDNGGKLLMTTSFSATMSNIGAPLSFSPVDSLGTRINRITRNQLVNLTAFAVQLGLPELKQNTSIIPDVFPLVPKVSANALYQLPEDPSRWQGSPVMAVIDADKTFVFFGLPLAKMDGLNSVQELIQKIFIEIF